MYMNNYIHDDLSKYKTMIRKTKEYLGTHFYIESAKAAKPSNDDPMQIIFNTILDIERGNALNTSLKDVSLACVLSIMITKLSFIIQDKKLLQEELA